MISFGRASVLGLALAAGCGGSSHVDSAPDASAPHARPPPAPSGPAGDGEVVLALRSLWLGETTTPKGVDASSCKNLGYDLDGLVSVSGQAGSCKPRPGALDEADGVGGVDNAFGASLAPVMLSVAPSASRDMSQTLDAGGVTLMLRLHGVGAGSQYFPVAAHAGVVSALISAHWDGNDTRDEVANTGLDFGGGYLAGDVWVSGSSDGVLSVPLPLVQSMAAEPEPFLLRIHRPLVTMQLAKDHESAEGGIVAGLLDVSEFTSSLCVYTCPCGGPPTCCVEKDQFAPAADSLLDGSVDPSRECDAISIALGFTASAVKAGAAVEPEPPPACP